MTYKRFSEWINLKQSLHIKKTRIRHVKEGEIWWASIGENVGCEINGKNKEFSRPVIIFRKLADGLYFIIPATTKNKEGSWYVHYCHQSINATACLHQARSIDYRRLWAKIGELDSRDFQRIKCGFEKLYISNFPHHHEYSR